MGLLPTPTPSPPTDDAQPDQSRYVDDGEPNVSPEEQAQYDEFMGNALNIMYQDGEEGGEVRPEILQALTPGEKKPDGPDPAILALANTAVSIVSKLDDDSRKAGKPVEDDVLMHGGLAVVEELAEISEAAKLHEYSEEDITGAFAQAVDMYRPKAIQDGRTSEETLKGQFAEINDAEAAGKLGDVLPGLGGTTTGEPPVTAEG